MAKANKLRKTEDVAQVIQNNFFKQFLANDDDFFHLEGSPTLSLIKRNTANRARRTSVGDQFMNFSLNVKRTENQEPEIFSTDLSSIE